MNKLLLLSLLLTSFSALRSQTKTLTIMDSIVFYDGYAKMVTEPVPAHVVRFRNDLYAKKITPEQLSEIGSSLTLNVTISALCDNYDRLGNVSLALVPKGNVVYDTKAVSKIEIGRFITPFMNKNV